MRSEAIADGVNALPPRDQMAAPARHLRDTYAITPGIPLIKREFGYYCLERWRDDGLPDGANFAELFQYDPGGNVGLGQLGWCEAAFRPAWETRILEDRGDHELEQDYAGRKVLYFKGRRNGFMPEYVDHPVKDQRTWEDDVLWRLDPGDPGRYADLDARMARVKELAARGYMVQQNLIGGYMYLRSLIGPVDLLWAFADQPELIHACMTAWFDLADAVIARHQEHVTLDEVFLAEDICFNQGPLISPDMMREFLFPYYQQLLTNIRSRQIDRSRHLYLQIDTDGFAAAVIPVYREIGMDAMSPFEVASGNDVVRIGREHPDLAMFGGIDKRVLAKGPAAIDAMVEYILPAMRARGGYIPTCDHGVPPEVSLADYQHYRKRAVELGG
ncbi:MAG: hypothetical protein HYU66_02640 [Armatimonadetes bacterium]|nr:hypothetical protein [Armatimonadota bacterium]